MTTTTTPTAPTRWTPSDIPSTVTDPLSALPTVASFAHGHLSLNTAYVATAPDQVAYQPARDTSQHHVFQVGMVLPESWLRTIVQHTEVSQGGSGQGGSGQGGSGQGGAGECGWRLTLDASVDQQPDCVYQWGLYVCDVSSGVWEVVQATDDVWEVSPSVHTVGFAVDGTRVCAAVAAYRNRASGRRGTGGHKNNTCVDVTTSYPVCVFGVVRVDMGQLPTAHTFVLSRLQLEPYDVETIAEEDAIRYADAQNRRMIRKQQGFVSTGVSQTLTAIRSAEQLAQPFAVLTTDAIAPFRWSNQPHFVLRFMVRGTVKGAAVLHVVLQPVGDPSGQPVAPTVVPLFVENGVFAGSLNTVFGTDVEAVHIRFHVPASGAASGAPLPTRPSLPKGFAIDITDLQSTPTPLVDTSVLRRSRMGSAGGVGGGGVGDGGRNGGRGGNGGSGGDGGGDDVADYASVEQLKQQVAQLHTATQTLERTPGPPGATGKRGSKGERGEALRFGDLDHAQKEELRGKRGVPGPQGKPMVFEALTAEQRLLLRGEKGDTGEKGSTGERGPTGVGGTCFTFDDLSDVQRQLLRGERGVRGHQGEALTFEELTEAQKAVLRGQKGERGQTGDSGERGERGRVGPTGPIGSEGKQGPRGLPGIPGSKGDRGEGGNAGKDGDHGSPAIIKTSFPSVELLRDFVHKSLNLTPNTYYIIDHPTELIAGGHGNNNNTDTSTGGDHGKLFVYTGELDIELTVGCSYVENIQALLREYSTQVRATVQSDVDEWKLSLTLRAADICVYQLRRGLESSIVQSGYAVKESLVTDDALQHVGKLCGVQGKPGERGGQGESGQSMLGMKLDHIGTEATRLKLQQPEPNTVFLQIQASKTHEAGFYLYDGPSGAWRLLHGVDVDTSFMQWMKQFVENPNQESVPLVLSMFATTRKQMDGQYSNVRQELQEYRTTNEKWKKYQFEHWKSMGNSQYQQFNSQLSEHSQLMESVVQQVNTVSDRSVNKDEIGVMKKLLGKQNETYDRKYKSLKESIQEFTERQTVDKHVFEQDQDTVQSKLRDIDASTLKMLKIIQHLKTAPWNKTIKQVNQENGKEALAVRQELETVQGKIRDIDASTLKMLQIITYLKTAPWNKTTQQAAQECTKQAAAAHQELVETLGELRELVYAHEQTTKDQSRTTDTRFDTLEHQTDTLRKTLSADTDSAIRDVSSTLRGAIDHAIEKTTRDTDKKLLQTVDALQKERADKDGKTLEHLTDLRAGLKETQSDLQTADERWLDRLDEQRKKQADALTHQMDRTRSDFAKSLREAETHTTDNLAGLQHDLKQHQTQQAFDTKTTTKRLSDIETALTDDIERKVSGAKTHADEKAREVDQRYANAVQGLTNDVQNVDAKCTTIDYVSKARFESVEEHIQQLHQEGQQQCESLVTKQHKDLLQLIDKLRDDLCQHQQKATQTLQDQHQRADTVAQDRHQAHETHFERLDKTVLDVRKTHEGFVVTCAAQEATRIREMDTFKKEVQTSVRELVTRMTSQNDALTRQLAETKRELHALIDSKQGDLRTEAKQAQSALEDRTTHKYDTHSRKTDEQLTQLRSVVEGICTHVDRFAHKEAGYREQHEARLQQVVGLLEKTFVELKGDDGIG